MTAKSLLFILIVQILSLAAFAVAPSADIPQGALWRLLESGKIQEAAELEARLSEILKNAPADRLYILSTGVSESYLAKFPGEIYGILKASDPQVEDSYRSEVAAYRLDRALGLNMVPLTVSREIDGKSYSVQLFYPAKVNFGEIDLRSAKDYVTRGADLKAFDFLLANLDRHVEKGHNILEGQDQRAVAIDHGRAFRVRIDYLDRPSMAGLTSEFSNSLKKLTPRDLRETLQDLLTPEQIHTAELRLLLLKSTLSSQQPGAAYIQPMSEVALSKYFPEPEHVRFKEFFDVLTLKKELSTSYLLSLTPSLLKILQGARTDKTVDYAALVAVQNWHNLSPDAKKQIIPLIWGRYFISQAKVRGQIMADLNALDPKKAAELRPREAPVSRFQVAPSCANIF